MEEKDQAEATQEKERVLICTRHGLGDAVQLSVVLRHIEKHRPNWTIHLAVLKGKASAYESYIERVYSCETVASLDHLREAIKADYDRVYDLAWHEVTDCNENAPSTKAEKCLRDVFLIEPEDDLCRTYRIDVRDPAKHAAQTYLRTITRGKPLRDDGRFPTAIIHYQGDTSAAQKDLEHHEAAWICSQLINDFGLVPVILDWGAPVRSAVVDQKTVFCPMVDQAMWNGLGTGDAEVIAALIEQSALMIGIDSGPLHVAAATGTPTIAVWKEFHPIHYLCPAPNVTNMIHGTHARLIKGNKHRGLAYFSKNYQHRFYRSFLVDLICLAGDMLNRSGFTSSHGTWVRVDNLRQDMAIVFDVYEQDCYQFRSWPIRREVIVDVGACFGAFARLAYERNPMATIVCCECCPENQELLQKNVGGFAKIAKAAITYEKNVALLNAVYPDCASTGGSIVLPRGDVEKYGLSGAQAQPGDIVDGQKREYWADLRPLTTATLEEVCDWHNIDFIDVLKLDCEGSEYSILMNCDLDRIGMVVGEYHGSARFHQMISLPRFASWNVEILRTGEFGMFRLTRKPAELIGSGD